MESREQIEVLYEVFIEWLRMHELDYDFRFYTQSEWTKKEGPNHFLKGAELIMVFENDLMRLINESVGDELTDLAAGFGYWYELGHAWNLGFYRFDDWPPLPPENAPYAVKLDDQRWQAKRTRILTRCKGRCEECNEQKALEVHHCYYRYGRQPWQYPDGAFLALCGPCHDKRAEAEVRFRLFCPTARTSELDLIRRVMRHCQYWFPREAVHEFLETLERVPGGIPIGGRSGEVMSEEQFERRRFIAEYRELRSKLFAMIKDADHPPQRGTDWPRIWP